MREREAVGEGERGGWRTWLDKHRLSTKLHKLQVLLITVHHAGSEKKKKPFASGIVYLDTMALSHKIFL